MGVRDYSVTAASNLTVGGIGIQEGMARSSVNNAQRAVLADTANLLLDLGGATPTTGSDNAYLLALPSAPTAYAENLFFLTSFHATNSGAATLNVSGVGVKDIKKFTPGSGTPVPLEATDIRTGRVGMLVYLATPNAFILLNPGDYATLDEDGLIEQDTQFTHPDPPSALARPWVNRGREMCSPFDIITNQSDQDEILSGAGTFDATTQLIEAFAWAKRVEFPGGIQTQPCFLVSDSLPLQNDQILKGNGCRLIIPEGGAGVGGWAVTADATTDHFGLFQCKNKSRWRIEGFHVNYTAGVDAGQSRTPKAVYFENSTEGWVVGNLFEGCKFETIWGGGSIAACQRLHINHNTFIDCARGDVTWPYLEAIKLNCMNSEAIGNNLLRPGIGISNSGLGNVVAGNVVDDPHREGIAIGDAYSDQGVMVGNRIRVYSHATIARRGIRIDDGPYTGLEGAHTVWEGNHVHVVGAFTDVRPFGIYASGPRIASIGKNIVTGVGQFTGVYVDGKYTAPLTHTRVDIDGITIRALTETGPSFGIQIVASDGHGVGDVTITARLRNCAVEGFGGLEHFPYDTPALGFPTGAVGTTLTGPAATATIVNVTVTGSTGVIYIRDRTGTFTTGQTVTAGSGGTARVANVTATSSYAYYTTKAVSGVFNGIYDHCWKTGGNIIFGTKQYLNSEQNNVPMCSVAASTIVNA